MQWKKDTNKERNGYGMLTKKSEKDIRDPEIDICFLRYSHNDFIPVSVFNNSSTSTSPSTHPWQKRHAGERRARSSKSRESVINEPVAKKEGMSVTYYSAPCEYRRRSTSQRDMRRRRGVFVVCGEQVMVPRTRPAARHGCSCNGELCYERGDSKERITEAVDV